MKQLQIAKNLSLPLDAVTQKIAVLGMTGSGKSYCMTKLAEMMLDARAQVVILDPKGEAWGLRLMADGKTPAYSIPVFGGDHGDIPLKPDMGRRIADLLVDGDYSAVLDVSEFISSELARFGYDFATRLFERKKRQPGAMSLMIDEAQDFIPQNPSTGAGSYEPKMLAAFERVGKQLRSKGVGMVLCGQRPQEINKKVLNMCECWFAFQMTGLQERDTMEKLIKDADREVASRLKELLPTLETGLAHIWSPRWLKVSDTFHILEKKTFDSSATPEVGARRVEPRKLSPVDVAAITEEMEDVIEEAEKRDPEKLLEQLARAGRLNKELERAKERLETELGKARAQAVTKQVAVPVIKPAELKRFESAIKKLESIIEDSSKVEKMLADFFEKFDAARWDVKNKAHQLSDALARAAAPPPVMPPPMPPPHPSRRAAAPTRRAVDAPPPRRTVEEGDGQLTGPEQRILDTLLSFESLGKSNMKRSNLAAFVGYAATTKAFKNSLSSLNTRGLIEYDGPGTVALTGEGRPLASGSVVVPDRQALHKAWFERLSGPEQTMLRLLIDVYPDPVTRTELAKAANYALTTKAFKNGLSHMRSLGLINYSGPGNVVATDMLFPEGLR